MDYDDSVLDNPQPGLYELTPDPRTCSICLMGCNREEYFRHCFAHSDCVEDERAYKLQTTHGGLAP